MNEEQMWKAAHAMNDAAETAQRSASTIEEAARRIACLLEDGYGGNGIRLIELLEQDRGFDLVAHLYRQRAFSERTFGPGTRTAGVLDHIRKELHEIEAKPDDVSEWVDVILLALDGAWRAGFSPEQIAQAIAAKQERNESRKWPDWRNADPGKAIEHIKGEAA